MSTGQDEVAAEPAAIPQVFSDPRIAELYRWSRPGSAAREFEQRFLERLRDLLGAEGAALWFDPGGEALYLRHKRKFPAAELQRDMADWQRHGKLLRWVADGNQPRVVEPGWTQHEVANPTPHELLIAGAQLVGAQRIMLEVFREPAADPARNPAADLELVAAAAEFAADYVRAERIIEERRAQGVRKRQQEFMQQVHSSLDPRRVAFIAANDGAQALGCDRVTVLLRKRRTARVAAVSGQTAPNRRANAVALMESFATRVLRGGEAVVSSPSARKCAPELEGSLKAYTAVSGSVTLFAVPLPPTSNKRQPPVGVLLVEQFDEKLPAEALAEGVQFIAAQTALSLRNATAHDQVLFHSLRGKLGRMLAESVRLRRIAVMIALAAVAAALWLVPWPLRMEGRGTLRAAQRRGVFAAESGTVRKVLVRHGEHVVAGQTIAVLENNELSAQWQQAAEQLAGVREQLKIREVERGDRSLNPLRQIQIDGEIAELTERATFLEGQQALLERRIAQLTLATPLDGVVTTWDPEQQLLNRPVQVGNLLVQVAQVDGAWRIELRVPDVGSGYVQRAWAERDPAGPGLPVDYILATHPDKQYRGWLVDVAPRTENGGTEPVVLMTIEPDPQDPPPQRDGADVRGKIHCGERPVGFVLLREVIEFVQSQVLF